MHEDRFLPISVATLVPSAALGLDLYRMGPADDQSPVLFRSSAYPLEAVDIQRLRQRGIDRLYISCEDRAAYQSQLRSLAEGVEAGAAVPLATRIAALNDVVRDVMKNSFEHNQVDQIVADAVELAEMTCALVSHDAFAVTDLFRVLHHDYTTFTHSANVALYAALLAKSLGFSRHEIVQITAGGLLHDLGKLDVSDAILCKPGTLNHDEFRVIQKHPLKGFRRLCDRDDLVWGQLMMVYQHHERLDGHGYPVGVTAEEIHPWAKLCAVVDVFEAVTSHRPYRTPMSRAKAMEILRRDADTAFDSEMVACWATTIRFASTS